jgi:PKD repeat protein
VLHATAVNTTTTVAVVAEVSGSVPQYVDPGTGARLSASGIAPLWTTVDFGDGSAPVTTNNSRVGCATSSPLVPLTQAYPVAHAYTAAGTYTVTYSAGACAPTPAVTSTIVVTVPAKAG